MRNIARKSRATPPLANTNLSIGVESSGVGLIVDSSVVIAGERQRQTVRQIVEQLRADHGEIDFGLSLVTVVELVHGIDRAPD